MADAQIPMAEPVQHPSRTQDTPLIHPHDKFWSLYLTNAKELDKTRVERWRGDSEGILIFTGLFAATVATFVVSSINQLSPDTAGQTVALLSQLVALANGTQNQAPIFLLQDSFKPSSSAVWVNSLWFLSLFIALICALMATMVQQWSRRYMHDAHIQGAPHIAGPVHASLSMGIEQFRFDDSTSIIISLLHLSVFLFFIGLLFFLFPENSVVAWAIMGGMTIAAGLYLLLSLLPMYNPVSPYQTPLTQLFRVSLALFRALTFLAADGIFWLHCFVFQNAYFRATQYWASPLSRVDLIKQSRKWPNDDQLTFCLNQISRNVDELHELESLCDALIDIVRPTPDCPPRMLWPTVLLILNWGILQHAIDLVESLDELPRDAYIRRAVVSIKIFKALARSFPGPSLGSERYVENKDHTVPFTIVERWSNLHNLYFHGLWPHFIQGLVNPDHQSTGNFATILSFSSETMYKHFQIVNCDIGYLFLLVLTILHTSLTPVGENTLLGLVDVWVPAISTLCQAAQRAEKTPYITDSWISQVSQYKFNIPSLHGHEAPPYDDIVEFTYKDLGAQYPHIFTAYPEAAKKICDIQRIMRSIVDSVESVGRPVSYSSYMSAWHLPSSYSVESVGLPVSYSLTSF